MVDLKRLTKWAKEGSEPAKNVLSTINIIEETYEMIKDANVPEEYKKEAFRALLNINLK